MADQLSMRDANWSGGAHVSSPASPVVGRIEKHSKMAECEISSDMIQQEPSVAELPKLSDLLDNGWKIFEEVDSTNEPLGSTSVQARVKLGVNKLEEASRMVAQLDLFSRNEELEEISTADLKYLLLPALLGALTLKQTGRDKRLEIVQTARVYFMDFLVRCNNYSIAQIKLPTSASNNKDQASESGHSNGKTVQCSPDLVSMAVQRQAKIEQYRQKKELEAKLLDVRRALDTGQADDEVRRNFYLLNIRRWITVGLEEIESIDQEVEILKKMEVRMPGVAKQPPQPGRAPMKPFILTKDSTQARVFGAGYPSLPTMTVDDWYQQQRNHGVFPGQSLPTKVAVEEDTDAQEREEEEKEKKAENDDEEALQKARNWDDWKDSHRRGYGNRHNMG